MKKPLQPRISEAEWEVMKLFWPKTHLTAPEVIEKLKDRTAWHPPTIKTLLNRLLKKGALGYVKEGRSYRYYARVQEQKCLRAETESFLTRFFGGSLTPMLAHFIDERSLSAKEIAQLRRLLEEKKP
jgi:BlaI family penicillinase repressor